jgi:tetratricopeptide (TPR) repeat protein
MLFTFYSYKGGVGRSMALANVAKWLSLQGLRVAMIDWDLEAPGLESFFFTGEKLDEIRNQLGLIDILVSYRRHFPRIRESVAAAGSIDEKVAALQSVLPPITPSLHPLHEMGQQVGTGGALYLLSAGWRAGDKFIPYAQAVQEFNWDNFYHEYEGEAYFEWLRAQFLASGFVDVVLVDSRTGVTEMGGVCTRQLADVVVIFSAPNLQNLEGVMSMAQDVTRADLAERRGRATRVIMVPSRVDNTAPARVNAFMERFTTDSQPFTPEVFRTLKSTFWTLRVPYAPTYAYQERLAIGETDSDKDLEESYKRLAAHMGMVVPPQTQLRRKLAAEIERIFGKLLPTVFVTYAHGDRDVAAMVRRRLEAANISVWPDPSESLGSGADWRQTAGGILEQSRFLVVVATAEGLQSSWIRQQWRRARELGVCVVPVAPSRLPESAWASIPGWMQHVQLADLERDWERVVSVVGGPTTAPRIPMMAPETSEAFVPRAAELRRMGELLLGGTAHRVGLYGLPGCGKTALAKAFCRSDEALTFFEDGTVWVSAGEDADPKVELQKVYAALTGEQALFPDLRQARSEVESRLAGKRCLFVVDDASSAEKVAAYPLEITGCRYLVTTSDRAVVVRAEAVPIQVGQLSAVEAHAVLERALPEQSRAAALDQLPAFANRYGVFPQPLRQAAAALTASGATAGITDVPVSPEISKAFDREVFGRLDDEARERLILLTFAAADTPVPMSDLPTLWSTDPASAARTVTRLADLSLLTGDPDREGVQIHPWVRHIVAKRYPDRDVGKLFDAAYARLDAPDQARARQAICRLVRLVETPEGVTAEPQPVPRSTFNAEQQRVIDLLAGMNVVSVRPTGSTASPPSVSLADDAAVRLWPRLRGWIAEDERFLLWRQRLGGYVADWRRTRHATTLLSGVLLDEASQWVATRREDFSDAEIDYIERSAAARVQAAGAALAPAGAQVRSARRRTSVALATAALAIVVLVGAATWLMRSGSDAAPAVTDRDRQIEGQVLQGDLLAERGDVDGAVRAYSEALAAGGPSAAIYFKRGSAYCSNSDLDKCIEDFDRAVAVDPNHADVLAARANARLQKGDALGALQDFDGAIQRDPRNASLYASRATARETVRRFDEAIQDYSTAVQLDPTLSDAFFRRANLLESAGNRDTAIADLRKVVDLNADATVVRAAQARLTRLGAAPTSAPAPTVVYLHHVDSYDAPVMEKLRTVLTANGFRVAGIQRVPRGQTSGDVRHVAQDATIAAKIGTIVESALADAGYPVTMQTITLTQATARAGRVEVWIPPLSLPLPRKQMKKE